MTRAECLTSLTAKVAALRLDHPTRVAIDGVDGSGKTTLADELVAPISTTGRQVIRASADTFLKPRADRYRRGEHSGEAYFFDSFDYPAMRAMLLEPLGPGGDRRFRSAAFDVRSDSAIDLPTQTAEADAVLLFDGVFLQRAELDDCWDVRIWVDAPFEITVPRAVQRDVANAAGKFDVASRGERYHSRYVPGQRIYLERCRPRERADVVVDNADLSNPSLRIQQQL